MPSKPDDTLTAYDESLESLTRRIKAIRAQYLDVDTTRAHSGQPTTDLTHLARHSPSANF